MRRPILVVLACAAGCAAAHTPQPPMNKVEPAAEVAPTESTVVTTAAPTPSATSAITAPTVPPAPTAPTAPPVVAPTAPPAPASPCDEIVLGPCKVNYSARRTCLVAEGYFSIDASAETPSQREKFYACIKKVQTLPAGAKECTEAGAKCAAAVSRQWAGQGGAEDLPTICAVPPSCATVLNASCGSSKKIIDDCYYAARKLKKP